MFNVKGNPWVFDATGQGEGNFSDWLVKGTMVATNAENRFAVASHGFLTGDGPVRATWATTIIAGLTADKNYWIIYSDAGLFQLAETPAKAQAGTAVAISDDGGDTNYLLMQPLFQHKIYVR